MLGSTADRVSGLHAPSPAEGATPPQSSCLQVWGIFQELTGLRDIELVPPGDRLGLGVHGGSERVGLEIGAPLMPFSASLSYRLHFCRDKQLADKLPCHIVSHQGCASLHGFPSSPLCSLPSSILLPFPHFPLSLCVSLV